MPTWCRPSTQSTPGDFFDVTHGIFVKRCTCCSFVIHIALKPYSCISESFISRPLSRDTASRVHMCWKWHEHHFSNFHVSCVFNVQLSDLNTLTFSKKTQVWALASAIFFSSCQVPWIWHRPHSKICSFPLWKFISAWRSCKILSGNSKQCPLTWHFLSQKWRCCSTSLETLWNKPSIVSKTSRPCFLWFSDERYKSTFGIGADCRPSVTTAEMRQITSFVLHLSRQRPIGPHRDGKPHGKESECESVSLTREM